MTARELRKAMTRLGWIEKEGRGDHIKFKSPDTGLGIQFPHRGNKQLAVGTLIGVAKATGLTRQELKELI